MSVKKAHELKKSTGISELEKIAMRREFSNRIYVTGGIEVVQLNKDELEMLKNHTQGFYRGMYNYAKKHADCLKINQYFYCYKESKVIKKLNDIPIPPCDQNLIDMAEGYVIVNQPMVVIEMYITKTNVIKARARCGKFDVCFYWDDKTKDLRLNKLYYISGYKANVYNNVVEIKITNIGMRSYPFFSVSDIEGLQIGAVCVRDWSYNVKNQIVLKYKDSMEYISCVHTAIAEYTGEVSEGNVVNSDSDIVEELEFKMTSSEHKVIRLQIEEHFFALNSYVQSIAEFGLMNMFRESYKYGEMNFGFNTAMQSQFIYALRRLDNSLMKEIVETIIFDIINSMPIKTAIEWIRQRKKIIESRLLIRNLEVNDNYEITYEN